MQISTPALHPLILSLTQSCTNTKNNQAKLYHEKQKCWLLRKRSKPDEQKISVLFLLFIYSSIQALFTSALLCSKKRKLLHLHLFILFQEMGYICITNILRGWFQFSRSCIQGMKKLLPNLFESHKVILPRKCKAVLGGLVAC